ncbi:MAG: ABC transporter ATP-binding protein [Sulfobacillus acidophilus]|uniref:ABC transporter ATP-binding protein n=1 Tax=Sulfobacillus acidophilus TaxID=53633 RepID=A0A2T2WF72_9FIRM|nr:MAG: ABC transporter ATP-binding protein [Sulfobacillus acidophilus]
MNPVICFDHVTKSFTHTRAVDDVSLKIFAGQSVTLLGPNGAGKSTSIALMLGLQKPTSGRVTLFGANPVRSISHERLGVVLQNVSIPDRLRVTECINLARGFYPHPLPLSTLLHLSGLEADAHLWANSLSGGKMRRLQFALAMAGDPHLLFLDEPTVGMDVAAKHHFWDTLHTLVTAGKTILLTTHDLNEADLISSRVIVMNHGRIVADAAPEVIKTQFASRQIHFSCATTDLLDALQNWPETVSVESRGQHYTISTRDSDQTLRRLLGRPWPIHDVLVTGGGLEEAFMRLTKEETK